MGVHGRIQTTLYLGQTYDLVKTNRQAFVQTTSNTGVGLSLDQIEIWVIIL
jgi:hypothetical protein